MAASMTPAPIDAGGARRTRRILIKGVIGLTAGALLFAACSSGTATNAPASQAPASQAPASVAPASEAPASAAAGSTTLGSNYSDAKPKAAVAAMFDYCTQKTGAKVAINTTDHGKFQDTISSYLQGTPDDILTWFAGYRMKFFADQGLATPIDDVWAKIGANYSDAFATASTGNDGKKYFVPIYNYPWVVMYRKSVFAEKGYTVPKTWDEFVTLAKKMKADGLVPLAFADKDGWPAMGTFDILNMRINGYKFHTDLMAGKEKWTDPKVKAVFDKWKELLPYTQEGALGRTWQEGAQAMVKKAAGMYFLGTFASQQATDPADAADLDFFPFPTLGTAFDAENAIDAPIDGFMLSKAPKDADAAKALLACIATGAAQQVYLKSDPSNVAAAKDADPSQYTDLQKKMAEVIGASGAIAQFLDRDTRPDFAGPNGMQGFIQTFLKDPSKDVTPLLTQIQGFYDSLPPQ
jgi:multiple sugar transport system substrate-binding protein